MNMNTNIKEIEENYQTFWKELICDKNDQINVEQVKKELFDYYQLLKEVPSVYSTVTNGTCSKTNYTAEQIINIFDEEFGNKAWKVDCLSDDWDDITENCVSNEDYKKAIFEYLRIEK